MHDSGQSYKLGNLYKNRNVSENAYIKMPATIYL